MGGCKLGEGGGRGGAASEFLRSLENILGSLMDKDPLLERGFVSPLSGPSNPLSLSFPFDFLSFLSF